MLGLDIRIGYTHINKYIYIPPWKLIIPADFPMHQETYEEHPYLEEEEDLFCLCGKNPKDLMDYTDYDDEQYIPSGSLW